MAESHIRIDEGIKRPKYPHKRPSKRKDTATGIIPAGLSPDTVLDRYMTESTTSQIAYEYGVSRKTLVRWLIEHRPDQWKQVQVLRALCRKEDADEGIESACDALSLARAREQLRSGQWDLERLDHTNYGQRSELTVNTVISMESVLDDFSQAILDRIKTVEGGVSPSLPSTLPPVEE